jgi:hypothetical protein
MPAISRVGLVAKHRVEAAGRVLEDLAAWLESRGIEVLVETAATERSSAWRGGSPGPQSTSRLPA